MECIPPIPPRADAELDIMNDAELDIIKNVSSAILLHRSSGAGHKCANEVEKEERA